MAGFKTHITVSSLVGVGYGGAAFYYYGVPLPACVLAGGLCGVSGMLPDLDSDSGTPVHESVAFAACVVPMMLLQRLVQAGVSHESMVLIGATVYLAIRFGLGALLRRYTVHRGMFHSIPAALIFGEIAFLLSTGEDVRVRLFKAGAVVLGYLTHLLLDEIWSIEWSHGHLRLKSSFGTALKLFGHSGWANVSVFAKLILFTAAVFTEPQWMAPPTQPGTPNSIQEMATHLFDHNTKR
jgi:hypothetical protein